MKVHFELRHARVPAGPGGKREYLPVEYVSIRSGHNGADTVHRLATDADRLAFRAEYLAFNPEAAQGPLFRSTSRPAHEAEPAPGPAPTQPPPPPAEALEELVLEELP